MSFIEHLVPIFGIIFTFGIPGLIIFWAIYTKHRERMRLIEKGVTPEEARKYFNVTERRYRNNYSALKFGIILLFLGMGIFLANILSEVYNFGDGVLIGLVILFVGAAYLIYYAIVSRATKISSGNTTVSEKN